MVHVGKCNLRVEQLQPLEMHLSSPVAFLFSICDTSIIIQNVSNKQQLS